MLKNNKYIRNVTEIRKGIEQRATSVWADKPIIIGPDGLLLEIEQRLRHLASLQTNWDSYGASPVGRVALGKTRKLLLYLYSLNLPSLPAAFIAPDPEGGIGIEWDFGLGREVLLTISAEGQLTYVLDMGRKRGEQESPLQLINSLHSYIEASNANILVKMIDIFKAV